MPIACSILALEAGWTKQASTIISPYSVCTLYELWGTYNGVFMMTYISGSDPLTLADWADSWAWWRQPSQLVVRESWLWYADLSQWILPIWCWQEASNPTTNLCNSKQAQNRIINKQTKGPYYVSRLFSDSYVIYTFPLCTSCQISVFSILCIHW